MECGMFGSDYLIFQNSLVIQSAFRSIPIACRFFVLKILAPSLFDVATPLLVMEKCIFSVTHSTTKLHADENSADTHIGGPRIL